MENTNITFEEAMLQLEQIVKALEDGSAALDNALELYEQGVRLVRFCNVKLEEAEQKVKILSSSEGGIIEKDFASDVY